MTKLQLNSKNHLIGTLEYLSSKEKQLSYKKAVPFVDIPGELICQWDSHFIKGQIWFNEIWTKDQWNSLNQFDIEFRSLTNKLPESTPDVPEIFQYKEWNEIMELSCDLLKKLKNQV